MERPNIVVTHDEMTYIFEPINDEYAQYRFARTELGGANSDRTSRVSFDDIPEAVLKQVRDKGYEPR